MKIREAALAAGSAIAGGLLVAIAIGPWSLATASPEQARQGRPSAQMPSSETSPPRDSAAGHRTHLKAATLRRTATPVRSLTTHYRIPKNYNSHGGQSIYSPRCPKSMPIPVGWGVWSSNYHNSTGRDGSEILGPVNRDGSATMWLYGYSQSAVLTFGMGASPKDGPMDLYVAQLCAAADGPTVIVK